MRLQAFGVIFTLIIIPLILVLSYYIGLQVKTLTIQKEYDSKLITATYDAMSSFEINTANEDLSSVSDSLRTIIEASNNVFFNSLATNLGLSNASKSYVEPFVPAILYTLYDGYYISAPTRVTTVLTDSHGVAVSVGDRGVTYNEGSNTYSYTQIPDDEPDDNSQYIAYNTSMGLDYGSLLYLTDTDGVYTANVNNAQTNIKNVLKSYVPYSARYTGTGFDINVVYTLDNYLTIEGFVDDIYYTKSGYLIDPDLVNRVTGDVDNLLNYNQNDAQEFIEAGSVVNVILNDTASASTVTISSGGGLNVSYRDINNGDVTRTITSKSECDETMIFLKNQVSDIETELKTRRITGNPGSIDGSVSDADLQTIVANDNLVLNEIQYYLDKMSANVYYVKARIFSEWVTENLDNVCETDIIEISGMEYRTVIGDDTDLDTGSVNSIYEFSNSGLHIFMDGGSELHKYNIIKNSIQYNLNLAMSTYNSSEAYSFDYAMPVLLEEEWERITQRVSITSFLQGYKCGLKTYSNYAVVCSSNNEISINDNDVYYAVKQQFNNEISEYHKIDCPILLQNDINARSAGSTPEYIAFNSKEVKYDKLYVKTASTYRYDHKNYACYFCINDTNYDRNDIFSNTDSQNLRLAHFIGTAKVRNNLYKMDAIDNSEGFEVIDAAGNSKYGLDQIKAIEVVFGTLRTTNFNETIVQFGVDNSGTNLNSEIYRVPTNQIANYTITIKVDPAITDSSTVSFTSLGFTNTGAIQGDSGLLVGANPAPNFNAALRNAIEYIRIIYK